MHGKHEKKDAKSKINWPQTFVDFLVSILGGLTVVILSKILRL